MEFFIANIWSTGLYIGNPTNIIVAEAYKISFFEYSGWMMLPTIASGAACYTMLYFLFLKKISVNFVPCIANE